MTDYQLMNMITLKGAKDLYGKAKGTGLFNLEQDLELQNLIKLGGVGKLAGKAGKAYLTKGLFQNLDQEQPEAIYDPFRFKRLEWDKELIVEGIYSDPNPINFGLQNLIDVNGCRPGGVGYC